MITVHVKKRSFVILGDLPKRGITAREILTYDTRVTRNGDTRVARNGDIRVARNVRTGYPRTISVKKRSFVVLAKAGQ